MTLRPVARLRWSLSQRLSLTFALLLLACCGASAWLQTVASARQEHELTQRLSLGLAAHIAGNAELMRPAGLDPAAVRGLFDKLMAVNPSVEVYVLDANGTVLAQAAPPDRLRHTRVDLAPVRRLLAGAPLPVFGDDPRGDGGAKVFSAAPLRQGGREAGFVYVVLSGENRDALDARLAAGSVLRTSLRSLALVALLGLLAGLAAFGLITRPLRELTAGVRAVEQDGMASLVRPAPALARVAHGGGDIGMLAASFEAMRARVAAQWQALTAQDQQRRELFATVSHDLRTPLTSLHGYLETLLLKADHLDIAERRRYLEIALGQSRKVGRLAQALFELARLEYGVVTPDRERFALPDLVQDVFQKFELAAEARQQCLHAEIAPGLPPVTADLGMIERVLTNLLDNALRHTPDGGRVTVVLAHGAAGAVRVEVRDTGPGIAPELAPLLFSRPTLSSGGGSGGLGLMTVQRIVELHGSDIRLLDRPAEGGAAFAFELPRADAADTAPAPAPAEGEGGGF